MRSVFDSLTKIDATTAEDMAAQTGLDFTAEKVETSYTYNNVEYNVPKTVAVIRTDDGRYLGTIGRNRGIVQYLDVLKFTEQLIISQTAEYISGGIIGAGEQVYLIMKTKDTMKLAGGDEIECYFYISSSHDSTKGLSIVPAPLRVTNGTVITLDKDTQIKFRHSKNVEQHLKIAQVSLSKVHAYFRETEKSFLLLQTTHINNDQLNTYLNMLIPDATVVPKKAENIRTEIETLYRSGTCSKMLSCHGTLLGAYFAYIEYVDKLRTQRKSKLRTNEKDAKIYSLLEGHGASKKADSLAFALQLTRKFKNVSLG